MPLADADIPAPIGLLAELTHRVVVNKAVPL
jgi:hypothetical protein